MTRGNLITPAQRGQLALNGLQHLSYPDHLQLVLVVRLLGPSERLPQAWSSQP
jgi:hypothetical protein